MYAARRVSHASRARIRIRRYVQNWNVSMRSWYAHG